LDSMGKPKNRCAGGLLLLVLFVLGLAWPGLPVPAQAGVEEEWARQYDWRMEDRATALALDSQGNIYVAGSGIGYSTIKYSPDGQQLWDEHYKGLAYGGGMPRAIATDSDGNVYVTGMSMGPAPDYDYQFATVKYDTYGSLCWESRYHGPLRGTNGATDMVVDRRGYVYVTGACAAQKSDSNFYERYSDYATIKYSLDGRELWVRLYNGPANQDDAASAIALDHKGYVYVTGTSSGAYATVKYSPGGKELWVRRCKFAGYDGGAAARGASVTRSGKCNRAYSHGVGQPG